MYTSKDLDQEIADAIDSVGDDESANPAFLTAAIIRAHDDECEETDSIFALCAYRHVRDIVGKRLAALERMERKKEKRQSEMFPLLQARYAVDRLGVVEYVPRMRMTYLERRRKAQELIKDGQATIEHGQQMDRETDALVRRGLLVPDQDAA